MLGVIGHPISHSLSPRMHNAAFAQDGTGPAGADFVYVAMDVRKHGWPTFSWRARPEDRRATGERST